VTMADDPKRTVSAAPAPVLDVRACGARSPPRRRAAGGAGAWTSSWHAARSWVCWTLRLRQIHPAAHRGRPDPRFGGESDLRGKPLRGPAKHLDGVPELRAVPWLTVLQNVEPGWRRRASCRGAPRTRAVRNRPDRSGRLPPTPIRASCPAACASASLRAALVMNLPSADGRALLRTGCADRRNLRTDLLDLWVEKQAADRFVLL